MFMTLLIRFFISFLLSSSSVSCRLLDRYKSPWISVRSSQYLTSLSTWLIWLRQCYFSYLFSFSYEWWKKVSLALFFCYIVSLIVTTFRLFVYSFISCYVQLMWFAPTREVVDCWLADVGENKRALVFRQRCGFVGSTAACLGASFGLRQGADSNDTCV